MQYYKSMDSDVVADSDTALEGGKKWTIVMEILKTDVPTSAKAGVKMEQPKLTGFYLFS